MKELHTSEIPAMQTRSQDEWTMHETNLYLHLRLGRVGIEKEMGLG